MESKTKVKKQNLQKRLEAYTKGQDIVVAFSGGADSSLLLKMTCEAAEKTGSQVYAVTMQTKLHTMDDMQTAERVVEETTAHHQFLMVDELKEAGIEYNPENRCYLCKKLLFSRLLKQAESLGADQILEGTNADDLSAYRPGLQAVSELGIRSPLAEAGLTKAEIRSLAKEYGISTAERPAAPCLATRFPYGTKLTEEKMECVQKGEAYLRSLGFYNVRLRVIESLVRIEVDMPEFEKVLVYKTEIIHYLRNLGYQYITLDLDGFRSGSMDVEILEKQLEGAE